MTSSGFPTRNLYEFHSSPLRAVRPTYSYFDTVVCNLWQVSQFHCWIKTFSLLPFSETHQISVLGSASDFHTKHLVTFLDKTEYFEVNSSKFINVLIFGYSKECHVTTCHQINEHPITLSYLARTTVIVSFIWPLVLKCTRFVDCTRPSSWFMLLTKK